MGETTERRILVTGALGQIGIELLNALSNKFGSESIVATDIRETSKLEDTGIQFLKLDVLDLEKLESVIKEFKINEVYHLAAILSATVSASPHAARSCSSSFNKLYLRRN